MFRIIVEIAVALLVTTISSCISASALAATEGKGEGKPQMQFFSSGDVVFIHELGAVLMLRDKNIIVDMVNPPNQRSKEYQMVDVKKDDVIMMVNGKKATALADLKIAYDSASVGQEIKFGIRRGKNMMIATFAKADQSKIAQQQVMTFDSEAGGDIALGDGNKKVMKFGPGEGNIAIVSELALILSEVDSKVAVTGIMDSENSIIKQTGIGLNDVVTEIQSINVKSIKEFNEVYSKLKVGDEFSVVFQHDGKAVSAKATKTAPDERPMMIKTIKNK
ncbi:MAG: PDZ domain-containing protein [Candidatus Zixiibacteriota bacterium]